MIMKEILQTILIFVLQSIRYEKDDARNIWRTPLETMQRRAGDCEDFALLLYFLCKAFGIPEQQLSMLYCYQEPAHILHLALLVQDSNKTYVMDSVADVVMERHERTDLNPLYSCAYEDTDLVLSPWRKTWQRFEQQLQIHA